MIDNKIPLSIDNRNLYLKKNEKFKLLYDDLNNFLSDEEYIKNKDFTEHLWFSNEIKFNNTIEGYKDDVELISSVIKDNNRSISYKKRKRIINLFRGYQYILKNKDINKETLKNLYNILSKGLLDENDLKHMGKYYREDRVFIYFSSNIDIIPDEGIEFNKIDEYMNNLFEYINKNKGDNQTDNFIISQIIHFYFVYIHPYFDINGRTSRTLSMWYLLNNNSEPYIIFNRGIPYKINDYYKIIKETKYHHNLTYFINYMMETIKKELEKEYIIDMVEQNYGSELDIINRQTIHQILSMNGILSLIDFTTFYNRYNTKIKTLDAYKKLILPLLEFNILDYDRSTKKNITPHMNNFTFKINEKKLDFDKSKIKYIKLK